MTLSYLSPLSAEDQLALGLDHAQPMAIADRVRHTEIDILNHVNNRAYLDWGERLRVLYFDHLVWPVLGDVPRPRTVVHSLSVRFVEEILPGADYVATARISAFRNSSYTMDQQVWSGGRLRARMEVVMVMLAPEGVGKVDLPEELRAVLVQRDGARDDR